VSRFSRSETRADARARVFAAAGARAYRWQRSVLAGVERTAPRQRPLEPQQQAPDGAQPPPSPQLPLVAEAPGPGSIALAGLTVRSQTTRAFEHASQPLFRSPTCHLSALQVLFYAAALALTLARGFVESGPAMPQ
jgi:hypothetical protein